MTSPDLLLKLNGSDAVIDLSCIEATDLGPVGLDHSLEAVGLAERHEGGEANQHGRVESDPAARPVD